MSEFVGWAFICAAAGFGVGALLAQWHRGGVWRYFAFVLAAFALAAFAYVTIWFGLDAPMWAKIIFTTSLQFVGSFLVIGIVIWIGAGVWNQARQQ